MATLGLGGRILRLRSSSATAAAPPTPASQGAAVAGSCQGTSPRCELTPPPSALLPGALTPVHTCWVHADSCALCTDPPPRAHLPGARTPRRQPPSACWAAATAPASQCRRSRPGCLLPVDSCPGAAGQAGAAWHLAAGGVMDMDWSPARTHDPPAPGSAPRRGRSSRAAGAPPTAPPSAAGTPLTRGRAAARDRTPGKA